MIVLFVLAIVAAVAVPALNSSLNEIKLDSAAREVVSAIQYTQSLAIKKGDNNYGVQFYEALDKFHCFRGGPGADIINPLDKKPYSVDFTAVGPLQGVDIESAVFGINATAVKFNTLGELEKSGTVVLSYGTFQKTITVSLPLGKISVN